MKKQNVLEGWEINTGKWTSIFMDVTGPKFFLTAIENKPVKICSRVVTLAQAKKLHKWLGYAIKYIENKV